MSFRKSVEVSARQNPGKPFLSYKGTDHTYGDALAFKDELKANLGAFDHIAVISNSGDLSYFSVFAAVVLDATFMHLDIGWPESRIQDILDQATPDIVVCHSDWASEHAALFYKLNYDRVVIASANHKILGAAVIFKKKLRQGNLLSEYKKEFNVRDLLYVMFTSGSTGHPKGVPIDAISAAHFATAMVDTFKIENFEHWLQPVDLHFDVSMMTIFPAWITSGRIVAIPSAQSPFGPRLIKKLKNIDNWVSVPSVIARAKSLGMLGTNTMPSLKRSFFCGEALPTDLAQSWADAAPNSEIHNMYGPTEVTIAATWHSFAKEDETETIVPIGKPLPGTYVRLGEANEIELGGPQVFHGYLGAPKTAAGYLTTDEKGTRWYKTGDLGQYSGEDTLLFKGRKDWQVKISGYRVEIEGIEAVIRKFTDTSLAAVVPLNDVSENSYETLVAFVETSVSVSQLTSELSKRLPAYMVPNLIVKIADFPKNANGKIDRNALIALASKENEK